MCYNSGQMANTSPETRQDSNEDLFDDPYIEAAYERVVELLEQIALARSEIDHIMADSRTERALTTPRDNLGKKTPLQAAREKIERNIR